MTGLFDTNDVFAALTREQAKVGDKGYFGNNLRELNYSVIHGEVHSLAKVNDADYTIFPFVNEHQGNGFALFLPADKVKKEPKYRPLKNIDELFSFLIPSVPADDYNTFEKVGLILCTLFELKDKQSGCTHYRKFSRICLSDEGIMLDECTLEHYFENYEIKIDGEFVPFGIKEE